MLCVYRKIIYYEALNEYERKKDLMKLNNIIRDLSGNLVHPIGDNLEEFNVYNEEGLNKKIKERQYDDVEDSEDEYIKNFYS